MFFKTYFNVAKSQLRSSYKRVKKVQDCSEIDNQKCQIYNKGKQLKLKKL